MTAPADIDPRASSDPPPADDRLPDDRPPGEQAADDLRPRSPLDRLRAIWGPPREYRLARFAVLRLLGLVYLFAFLGLVRQGLPLLGAHGVTPMASYLDELRAYGRGFLDVPSLFWIDASDGTFIALAWLGVALSALVLAGVANLPMLLALWALYSSFVHTGQIWFGFGWEIQLLETGFLAAFLAPLLDARPLPRRAPPWIAIALFWWLAFRIMLGAGLIKWRGDACWRELTCLDWHFETQPIPNPLSPFFHRLPHAVLASGVVFNHVCELVCPWLLFAPRRLRVIAAGLMTAFQIVLVLSGNLAFLNWLTLVPLLAAFDDDVWRRFLPARGRAWLDARPAVPAGRAHVAIAWLVAGLVAILSIDPVANLASSHQAMNRSFGAFALVNTYGAFGSVGDTRDELIFEGTSDTVITDATVWKAYELPCKPGDPRRRPCLLGPYHLRLDWLMWFAAMGPPGGSPWAIHWTHQLLTGAPAARALLGHDPFPGAPPHFLRVERYRYHFAPTGDDAWWRRERLDAWLPPLTADDPELVDYVNAHGWRD